MDGREQRTGHPVAAIAAALCIGLAVANLGGWLTVARLLISVAPGLPAMVPATAVLSLLAAAALWAQWRWPGGMPWRLAFPGPWPCSRWPSRHATRPARRQRHSCWR